MGTYKLISLDKIPSTQDWAHDLIAEKKAFDKTVIVATAQTAGRGRYRRKWVSRTGNLYASFIYKNLERDSKLSYAIGVAVAETLINFGMSPKIKWPNDILIDGKKISGILIEYAQNFVIVGIGVNIKTCPKVPEYETTKVDNFTKVTIKDVLNILIKKIDALRGADFEVIRKRWTELALSINKKIKYHGKEMEMIGLNVNGALILRCGSKYLLTYGDEISV
ncbi:MAG: biotin--[acetyl-CoA-carboxylase] ligase [Alphaproteobacteria bacterium]|nr:biotin--[acetyl-CoA-carboxylase] ligase [Alphaproteobacteria bacterium]